MKPIFKDNIYRGLIKQGLFVKTSFFGFFINRLLGDGHPMNFSPQHHPITSFNHLIFILVPILMFFKPFTDLIFKLNNNNAYIHQYIPMEV